MCISLLDSTGVDHGTIHHWTQKNFEVPENISPRKKKNNCNNLDKRRIQRKILTNRKNVKHRQHDIQFDSHLQHPKSRLFAENFQCFLAVPESKSSTPRVQFLQYIVV